MPREDRASSDHGAALSSPPQPAPPPRKAIGRGGLICYVEVPPHPDPTIRKSFALLRPSRALGQHEISSMPNVVPTPCDKSPSESISEGSQLCDHSEIAISTDSLSQSGIFVVLAVCWDIVGFLIFAGLASLGVVAVWNVFWTLLGHDL
ncbi:hypothetical protein B0H21DRAFT_822945 [Amylocystis lapponica]|nr:hypothetical protein B0H21DRAFT_822945 [Amylocystis lapponica]